MKPCQGCFCADRFSSLTGSQAFKPHLEPFIEPVFDSLTCGQQTTAAAAGEFIGQVRDLLGPNIWAGRLTQEQQQAQASSPHVPPPTGEPHLYCVISCVTYDMVIVSCTAGRFLLACVQMRACSLDTPIL